MKAGGRHHILGAPRLGCQRFVAPLVLYWESNRLPRVDRKDLVVADDAVQLVILPVHGQGYASTIRGYLALEGDMETVAALTITEQGETMAKIGSILTILSMLVFVYTVLRHGFGSRRKDAV